MIMALWIVSMMFLTWLIVAAPVAGSIRPRVMIKETMYAPGKFAVVLLAVGFYTFLVLWR